MADALSGFLDIVYNLFTGIVNGFVSFLTFNPIAGALGAINTSAIRPALAFIGRWLPISQIGGIFTSFLPVFITAVLILLAWRWFKAVDD